MLWKCCTQYASKFGKLSSGHRTRKGQSSFRSQRKAMPKNAQSTAQLHSSYTLKILQARLQQYIYFQRFKLVLEKAKEQEIKLPSVGSSKKQENSRKTSTSALLTMPKPLTMDHNKLLKILDAWGWCTGMTQRDGMGREEGGGFRMGNTCIPVVDSFRYLAKVIQYCQV